MRLLHTADWHLGRLFHGVHLTEDQAYVLDQLVDIVRQSRPDALIIAGDIYDRAVPPPEAVALLDDVLSRIVLDLQVRVIVIAGNHDSPDRLGFASRLLASQGLHVCFRPALTPTPMTIEDSDGPLHIFALPYVEPAVVRQMLGHPSIQDHDTATSALLQRLHPLLLARDRCVLVAHLLVQGGLGSESERPLSLRTSGAVQRSHFDPFCYVALGHLHRAQCVGSDGSRAAIRYAGSPLKYSFSEAAEAKSVSQVEIDRQGNCHVETIELRPRRDVRQLRGRLTRLLQREEPRERHEDYIKVILEDEGPVLDAMGRLRARYPNTLQIERAQLTLSSSLQAPTRRLRGTQPLGDVEMFGSFFSQVTGMPLTRAEQEAFAQIVSRTRREEREAQ